MIQTWQSQSQDSEDCKSAPLPWAVTLDKHCSTLSRHVHMHKHLLHFHVASEPGRILTGGTCTIQRVTNLIRKKKKKQEVLSHHMAPTGRDG